MLPVKHTRAYLNTVWVSNQAITNYHKLIGLKRHKLIILQFGRSEVCTRSYRANVQVSARLCSLWRHGEGERGFLAFHSSQGCLLHLTAGDR